MGRWGSFRRILAGVGALRALEAGGSLDAACLDSAHARTRHASTPPHLTFSGSYGRALLDGGADGAPAVEPWQVGLGLALSAASVLYVGRLATAALEEEAAKGGDE